MVIALKFVFSSEWRHGASYRSCSWPETDGEEASQLWRVGIHQKSCKQFIFQKVLVKCALIRNHVKINFPKTISKMIS
jgi:hypothetical protein